MAFSKSELWIGAFLGTGLLAFLLWPGPSAGPKPDGTGVVAKETAPQAQDMEARDYFALAPEARGERLIAWIRRGSAFERLWTSATSEQQQALRIALVHLLARKDPALREERWDTATVIGPDGTIRTERVNVSVDDSRFKARLLDLLAKRLTADSLLLEEVFNAYADEGHPRTRQRIVRAIATIGGPRARRFLEAIVRDEGPLETLAAQEARRALP